MDEAEFRHDVVTNARNSHPWSCNCPYKVVQSNF